MADQPKWGNDKIIGRGANSEPVNAAQVLWAILEQADKEWTRQESDPPLPESSRMTEDNWRAYNNARLVGELNSVISIFRVIRKQNETSE